MSGRLPPWKATGFVEKAWKRIDPPTQKELARRLDLSAHTNLSKLNNGKMPMTHDYAMRIVKAVRRDDKTFTVADLGAPTSVVAAADPTVLDRLQELAETVELAANLQISMERSLGRLQGRVRDLEAAREADEGAPRRRATRP